MADAMARFKTRALFNSGVKVFLTDPSTGEKTDDYLTVRNRRSDAFRAAAAVADQMRVDAEGIEDEAEKRRIAEERGLIMAASLVSDWSFDVECNQDTVIGFLRDAEQVAEQVMAVGLADEDFFAADSNSSTPGPKKKSRS